MFSCRLFFTPPRCAATSSTSGSSFRSIIYKISFGWQTFSTKSHIDPSSKMHRQSNLCYTTTVGTCFWIIDLYLHSPFLPGGLFYLIKSNQRDDHFFSILYHQTPNCVCVESVEDISGESTPELMALKNVINAKCFNTILDLYEFVQKTDYHKL